MTGQALFALSEFGLKLGLPLFETQLMVYLPSKVTAFYDGHCVNSQVNEKRNA